MSRSLYLGLLIFRLVLSQGEAKTPAASLPSDSDSVELVYVQNDDVLTTYQIDPQTLRATRVGAPFFLPTATLQWLRASGTGHFLYLFQRFENGKNHLWVYSTDESGVPQSPAVQQIGANHMYDLQFDPGGNFAYAIVDISNGRDRPVFEMIRFTVDVASGKLSNRTVVASWPLQGGLCRRAESYGPMLRGFSADGTQLYSAWICNFHHFTDVFYYQRTVDPDSGEVGQEIEVLYTSDDSGRGDLVTFRNRRLVDYHIDYLQQGINDLNLYRLVPDGSRLLLQCSAYMLQACGWAQWAQVHPSGKYIFFQINDDVEQIARIDLPNHNLFDTGHYIPDRVTKFNSDGTIVYGDGYSIDIYGFDLETAWVTPGGVIAEPDRDTFWPVERH